MRRKPNVCAYGYALVAGKEGTEVAYGTSFSTPLVSGFAACAWQSNKSLDNMEIFKKIEASADLYPYYDYAHGYGVPQASHFTSEEEKAEPTFELVIEGNKLNAVIDKAQFDLSSKDSNVYFYYHFENNEGYLDKYYVLLVEQHDILSINIDQYEGMRKITMHFAGYTKSHKF
jgi:subtilase family serine protease